MRHVDDGNNPADFLTKWLERQKLDESVAYASNSANAVTATNPAFRAAQKALLEAALIRCEREDDNAAIHAESFTARVINLAGDIGEVA